MLTNVVEYLNIHAYGSNSRHKCVQFRITGNNFNLTIFYDLHGCYENCQIPVDYEYFQNQMR